MKQQLHLPSQISKASRVVKDTTPLFVVSLTIVFFLLAQERMESVPVLSSISGLKQG